MNPVRLWVYKCNVQAEQEGDWDWFFAQKQPRRWGGTWSSQQARSLRFIRHDMAVGDLVLAWQSDMRKMLGLCRVAQLRRRSKKGASTPTVDIVLKRLVRFAPPISRDALPNVPALTAGSAGMLHPTTRRDAMRLLTACGADQWKGEV